MFAWSCLSNGKSLNGIHITVLNFLARLRAWMFIMLQATLSAMFSYLALHCIQCTSIVQAIIDTVSGRLCVLFCLRRHRLWNHRWMIEMCHWFVTDPIMRHRLWSLKQTAVDQWLAFIVTIDKNTSCLYPAIPQPAHFLAFSLEMLNYVTLV